jgi:hypothetical protein
MDWVAFSALGVSCLSFVWTGTTAYQTSERAKVTSSLELLTSDSIAGARSIVGAAARAQQLNEIEKQKFTEAAFRLMWAIQRSVFAARTIRRTALAPQEALWLYRHVESITGDLNAAIRAHGSGIDWNPTVNHTNEALEALPDKVRNEWSKLVVTKSFHKLELPRSTAPIAPLTAAALGTGQMATTPAAALPSPIS